MKPKKFPDANLLTIIAVKNRCQLPTIAETDRKVKKH
jgi:hypothetical protein